LYNAAEQQIDNEKQQRKANAEYHVEYEKHWKEKVKQCREEEKERTKQEKSVEKRRCRTSGA